MAPNTEVVREPVPPKEIKQQEYKIQIVWFNVFMFTIIHLGALYGLYLCFTSASFKTILFAYVYGTLGMIGATAGSHRLWSHRSYKAKWPLRLLLCIFTFIAGQMTIYQWAKEHRLHHKCVDTDADPHNIKRGLFFAHMGWMMCRKHPDVAAKGKNISLEDVWADPIVKFQFWFYYPMFIFFRFILPPMVLGWAWNESVENSFFVVGMLGWICSFHGAFSINSLAHKYGDKPFNKNIEATENIFVSYVTTGEGWHNYHHVFPWDYSASELGWTINISTIFIDLMAMIGQAYDLKTPDSEMIKSRKLKSGDGTRLQQVDKLKY